jgi:hypothetical protein
LRGLSCEKHGQRQAQANPSHRLSGR